MIKQEQIEEECDVVDDYTIGFATYLMQKRRNEDIKKALEYCTGSEGIEGCEKCSYFSIYMCNDTLCKDAHNLITEQEKDIKQLKTECALLDDELRIARQETIDVLNKLKTKAFDKDAFNGWAGSTFVVLVRDIDKMIEELTKLTNC